MQKEEKRLPKLIVILGPTASGKTSWALQAVKKYNGEIISADSRQIYKYMDIGTAKAKGEWKRNGLRKSYVVDDVVHHLIDFLNPGKTFTVAEFRDKAIKYAKLSQKNKKIPFLVGGTGLYISAVVDNFTIPRIPPHKKMRKSLEEKTNEQLMKLLEMLDPDAAAVIDANNKRRIIRALEVTILSGEPFSKQKKKGEQLFDILEIGIDVPRDILYQRIDARVDAMIEEGLLDEIQMSTLEDANVDLKKDTYQFARRQLTWFRRDKRIQWCKTYEEADKYIKHFLET
jgi:tRNA dimethylallyltransferase